MPEENQAQQVTTKEPQQVMKEPQQVTMKDPKKVEAGKRLVAIKRKKKEEQVQLERTARGMNQYYGFGAILALGAIGSLGNNIYQTKKGEQLSNPKQNNPKPHPQTNKFEMD